MNILVVVKQSKYEYEKQKFGLSHEEIVCKYSVEHADLGSILQGHERQLESRKLIQRFFPDATFLMMNELKKSADDFDLVISFGGDNSFTYTSHFVKDKPLVGINSDPERSVGALCTWSARDIERFSERIKQNDCKVEEWTRLEAEIDGKPIAMATSDYFFGEKLRKDMSRHVFVYRGNEYEQKSSGVIVATGAGSTGWYDSAVRYIHPRGNMFPRTEKKALFVVAEPFRYRINVVDIYAGEILDGEELTLYSLNDGDGYATSDSWDEYDFYRGKKVVVRISDNPLHVIAQ